MTTAFLGLLTLLHFASTSATTTWSIAHGDSCSESVFDASCDATKAPGPQWTQKTCKEQGFTNKCPDMDFTLKCMKKSGSYTLSGFSKNGEAGCQFFEADVGKTSTTTWSITHEDSCLESVFDASCGATKAPGPQWTQKTCKEQGFTNKCPNMDFTLMCRKRKGSYTMGGFSKNGEAGCQFYEADVGESMETSIGTSQKCVDNKGQKCDACLGRGGICNRFGFDQKECAKRFKFGAQWCGSSDAVFNVLPTQDSTGIATYAFAALGLGFLVFGAYKHYCVKTNDHIAVEMA